MPGRLQDRTALITGATGNIGRHIAAAFAAEGAHVVVSGRNAERGQEVVDGIVAAGGRAGLVTADLDGTAAASQRLVAQATDTVGGRLDILVNNAAYVVSSPTAAVTEADLDRVWAVNVKAPFFLVAAAAPAMVERGDGVILNLSSWLARIGAAGAVAYNATKGAIDTLTRDWAAAYGPSGVRVNGISPGAVRDPSLGDVPHPADAAMRGTPVGRRLPPTAIADAAVYLASAEGTWVHGTTLDVDGGRTAVAVFASGQSSR